MMRKTPSSAENIPLSVPDLAGREWEYVKECLDTGWVSSAGKFVERFERAFADYAGARHGVAVVNGTAALHIALKAVGTQPGEEVLVSDLTFIAPVNAVRYCAAHPVFMDAHPKTWQMDPAKVERFLKEECVRRGSACFNKRTGRRVRAMIPVHILGLSCEMDTLVSLARSYGLKVVEDAAEAAGVRFRGRHVGTFGDVGAFSFNGNKIITTGGGGILLTADAALARYARYLTTQAKDNEDEYIHNEVGYNYRLNNIQAALGLAQLEQLEDKIAKKRALAQAYVRALSGTGLELMPKTPHTDPTYWLYTILLPPATTVARRKAFIRRLAGSGINARSLWHPIHGLAPYRDAQAYRIETAPDLYARAISLPSSPGLSEIDQRRTTEAVLANAVLY